MLRWLVGVMVLVLVVVGGVSLVAGFVWNNTVDREVDLFLAGTGLPLFDSQPIQAQDLAELPEPVRRWLRQANVVGAKPVRTVRLQQEVTLRLDSEAPWLSGSAVQYFRTREPGFLWHVRLRMNPLLHIVGRDRYADGGGHMQIMVQSLFPVVDAAGREIDQGTLLRYLAEVVWFPTAALDDRIQWQAVDEGAAQAAMTYGGVTVTGMFHFDAAGQVTRFEAQRYKESEGTYSLEDWIITMTAHRSAAGLVIPTKADVTWRLAEGDFHWFSCEVTAIEYTF